MLEFFIKKLKYVIYLCFFILYVLLLVICIIDSLNCLTAMMFMGRLQVGILYAFRLSSPGFFSFHKINVKINFVEIMEVFVNCFV